MSGTQSISHDPALVLLSILIGLFAAYAVVGVFRRITKTSGPERVFWLTSGALALGGGGWSVHFVGLLSMGIALPITDQLAGTLTSFLIILTAALSSLYLVCREGVSVLRILAAGLILGVGVASMQVTGVQVIELTVNVTRSWTRFFVISAVACVLITAALWMMAGQSFSRPLSWQRLVPSMLLALSFGAVHYGDAMATTYTTLDNVASQTSVVFSREILMVLLAFGAGIVLTIVLISAIFDRRMSQAESDALRQSEERFRIMAEALPISMAVTRVEDREVVYSNQRSIELFQVPDDPAQREPASQRYVNPEDRQKVADAVSQHGFVDSFETKMRKYDGTEFWALISAKRTPTMQGDMIVSGYYDITDRKRIERELEEKEEKLSRANTELQRAFSDLNKHASEIEEALQRARAADQATRAKSTFLATMSHEIRTPMNGVLGLLELLSGTELDADQAETVRTINESAKAMLSLIDDILDFSKIEAGKMDMEDAELDLVNLIESVGTMTIANARKKGLSVQVFIDPDIPSVVIGDGGRLRQILNNLVSNALKFTENGYIRIHANLDRRTGSQAWLRLDIKDSGIGISPENQRTLFEPFAQAERSTTRKYGGTGLGLAISERLVSLMGGTLTVDSREGAGSTFTVTVPVQVSATVDEVDGHEGLFQGHTAILVTKNQQRAQLAARYLSWLGFELEVADSISEAGSALANWKPQKEPCLMVIASDVTASDLPLLVSELRNVHDEEQLKILAIVDAPDLPETGDTLAFSGLQHILQPVLRTAFMDGVVNLMAGTTQRFASATERVPQEATPKPTLARGDALANGQLILVAEDHETNRMVIKRQLSRLGYTADVVCDGREALEAIKATAYGLLLTDCNMPEMDGMELTGRVRNLNDPSKSEMPIVAITANALSGEAERCLAAGMNDYLSKPVSLDQLSQTLKKWLPEIPSSDTALEAPDDEVAGPGETSPRATHEEAEIDKQVLTDLVGDDDEAIRELLESFMRNASASYEDLKRACADEHEDEFEAAAHKLSGSAKTAGAGAIVASLEVVRQSARESDWNAVQGQLTDLSAAIVRTQKFVERG